MNRLKRNIPNLLSAYRIAAVPVLLALFFVGTEAAIWTNCVIFFIACWTDYFDGVIARKNNYSSVFGKFLDATSDKILIGSVLLMLIAFERLTGYWIIPALLIFIRELLVSGLREFLGQYRIAVPVSWAGKCKTAVQMLASGFLMAGEFGPKLVPYSMEIGLGVFLIATILTIMSGYAYLKIGLDTIKIIDDKGEEALTHKQ